MRALVIRIYLSENDTYKGRATYNHIVEFLRDSGVAGATAFRGIEGYGVHSRIHTSSILRLGSDLPVIVEAVDIEGRIRPLIPSIREMVPGELITLQEVEIAAGEKI